MLCTGKRRKNRGRRLKDTFWTTSSQGKKSTGKDEEIYWTGTGRREREEREREEDFLPKSTFSTLPAKDEKSPGEGKPYLQGKKEETGRRNASPPITANQNDFSPKVDFSTPVGGGSNGQGEDGKKRKRRREKKHCPPRKQKRIFSQKRYSTHLAKGRKRHGKKKRFTGQGQGEEERDQEGRPKRLSPITHFSTSLQQDEKLTPIPTAWEKREKGKKPGEREETLPARQAPQPINQDFSHLTYFSTTSRQATESTPGRKAICTGKGEGTHQPPKPFSPRSDFFDALSH
jgi:hypothetical protein